MIILKKTGYKADIIKIDVEGAEVHAFMGMKKIISKNRNIKIFSEFCPFAINQSKFTADDFLNFFSRQKFRFFEILDKEKKVEATTPEILLKKYADKDIKDGITNLLMYR